MLAMGRRFLERRKSPRFSVSKNAKILYRGGSCQMNCSVVEVSNSGARLQPADAGLLPNEFDLVFSPSQRVKCEAVYRSSAEIGVRFLSR